MYIYTYTHIYMNNFVFCRKQTFSNASGTKFIEVLDY